MGLLEERNKIMKDIELVIINDKLKSKYIKRGLKFFDNDKLKDEINTAIFPDLTTARKNIPLFDTEFKLSALPLLNNETLL